MRPAATKPIRLSGGPSCECDGVCLHWPHGSVSGFEPRPQLPLQGRPTPPAKPSRRPTGFAVSALWAALLVLAGCGGTVPQIVITVPTPPPAPPVTQPSSPPVTTPTPVPTTTPEPVETPTPAPTAAPTAPPTAPPSAPEQPQPAPSAPPACEPRVVTSQQPAGCVKCPPALADLETVGYAVSPGDQRFLEMDNCGAGDMASCAYVSRQPVEVQGKPYPACTWFNSKWKPRTWGWEKPICTEVTAVVPCTDPTGPPPPAPVPAPGQGDPGESCDAAKLITLHVAGACKVKGAPFDVYTGADCLAWVTYTPKQSTVDENGKAIDAKNHGRDLTRWVIVDGQRILVPDTLQSEDTCVPAGPVEFCGHHSDEDLFNAYLRGVRPGSFTLSARLRCGGRELWSNADGKVLPGTPPGAEPAAPKPGGGRKPRPER